LYRFLEKSEILDKATKSTFMRCWKLLPDIARSLP